MSMLERKGIPFENINSHSNRKGSATNAASGSTQAPPIVAICLRAGWALAGVLDRYLSLENAGDQFVGRVTATAHQAICGAPTTIPEEPYRGSEIIEGTIF